MNGPYFSGSSFDSNKPPDVAEPIAHPEIHLESNKLEVPIIDSCSYDAFHQTYLVRNFPCVIQKVGTDWKASKLWCQDEKPCFEYLRKQYGESIITVYHNQEKYFDSHTTSTMKFKKYVDYWKNYNEAEDKTSMKLLYLKDWHMKNEYKNDDFYEVPLYFSSDWLNEYLVANGKDDYRFVYMGPAGSWTPFHRDVMSTYSWSVNVCGYKKWILFPPGEEKKLMEGSQLPFSIKQVPHFVTHCELVQRPGDAIFVPTGWHHIVWNLEDTISINHNWANGVNIGDMEICLHQSLKEVEEELKNLSKEDDFQTVCQNILRQHAGMNHEDFFEFIRFITLRRIRKFVDRTADQWVLYDLNRCNEMLSNRLKPYLSLEKRKEADLLLKEIEHVINQ